MELATNNLFKYATSELSQDAFVAWLMSYAMKENAGKDEGLTSCARKLISKMYKLKENEYVTEIKKQYYNIDLLLIIGDINIIIEDKTFTSVHDDQINNYKNKLISLGVKEQNIICVYYKIADQAKPEPGVINIFRRDILDVFIPYYEKTNNPIFRDYCDYLCYLEEKSQLYTSLPIEEWSNHAGVYEGFFSRLIAENVVYTPVDGDWDWYYVANPSGGFMCFWWQPLTKDEQRNLCIDDYISGIYLEIEDDIIVVKLTTEEIEDREQKRDTITDIRWNIYDQMKKSLKEQNFQYEKGRFQWGKHMSAGFLRYNYANYKEMIAAMERALKTLVKKYKYEAGNGFILK